MIYCTTTNRYLFLLRNNGRYSDTWGLVGGKIEVNETVQHGLEREIQEELGGIIKDAKYVPVEQYTSDNGRFVYHTFLIPVDDEFIPVLNKEHKGYAWCPINYVPKPLHPGVWKTFSFVEVASKLKTMEKLLS
mgnify:CR=1 FL=1